MDTWEQVKAGYMSKERIRFAKMREEIALKRGSVPVDPNAIPEWQKKRNAMAAARDRRRRRNRFKHNEK